MLHAAHLQEQELGAQSCRQKCFHAPRKCIKHLVGAENPTVHGYELAKQTFYTHINFLLFSVQSWRSAYYFAGIVGVVALVYLLLVVEEPKRDGLTSSASTSSSSAVNTAATSDEARTVADHRDSYSSLDGTAQFLYRIKISITNTLKVLLFIQYRL